MAVTQPAPTLASTDPTLQPFLQADFDPVHYLNNTLPTLTTSSGASRQAHSHVANLTTLSSETQTLLTRLNAQTTRLSNNLTQLTDEIIRSGGRLAYEVELLRGEAIGLTDALETGLKDDIKIFLPDHSKTQISPLSGNVDGGADVPASMEPSENETQYLERLHVLTTVRERLDAVIKVFDAAMNWPIAPSKLASTSSSLISITAPSTDEAVREQETKAQDFTKQIEDELKELSLTDAPSGEDGLASQRVEQLRDIARVWQGTSEEKARTKALDDLQSLVEERQKKDNQTGTIPSSIPSRPTDYRYGNLDARVFSEGSYNFLHNLRNAKE